MRRTGQYICAANCTGAIHILDANSLKLVRTWQAHSSVVSDMDARADFLVTCGLSQRQQHGMMHDPLAPIPFQPGAAFVRMHPKNVHHKHYCLPNRPITGCRYHESAHCQS